MCVASCGSLRVRFCMCVSVWLGGVSSGGSVIVFLCGGVCEGSAPVSLCVSLCVRVCMFVCMRSCVCFEGPCGVCVSVCAHVCMCLRGFAQK